MDVTYLHNATAIRFATFLAPTIYPTYEYIARSIGEKVGYPTRLSVGQSLEEIVAGQVDVGFLCCLPYVRLVDAPESSIELLAAPVLRGARYQNRPVYFSDVVVRSDSPYRSFDALAGCVWAYNQATSHSGYNIVCASLLEQGKTLQHFGTMVETGSHQRSLQMVLDGKADATAIDSHVLDVLLMQDKDLAFRLRVVAVLGPSSIPPVVVARGLDDGLKCQMREALLTMHGDPAVARVLHAGGIDHFVAVTDADYDDVRAICEQVQSG